MKLYIKFLLFALLTGSLQQANAQTDLDAIMMGKNQLCVGPMYSYNSWKNYWEGTLKRENLNLGTVSSQTYALGGAYGISGKLNLIFNAPYITTNASDGTLHGMKGLQDFSLYAKWLPIEKDLGKGTFSLYLVGGVSLPMSNYAADFLPLSIGIQSKTASARLILDYQVGHFFATGSATYISRDNIKIDRTAYYTTEVVYSNEVEIPNATNYNFKTGYRSGKLIAEATVNNWTTLGGFDISRNNMPFPSNKMNATMVGADFKYTVNKAHDLSFVGGFNTTVAGRNVGQSTAVYGSIFYVIDFSHKTKPTTAPAKAK